VLSSPTSSRAQKERERRSRTIESVAFALKGDAAEAVEQLEESTREFPGDALILRFGRLWGPGTFYQALPQGPAVHIDKAGAEAARLLAQAPPGTYIVA
jgi:hypothetical protein